MPLVCLPPYCSQGPISGWWCVNMAPTTVVDDYNDKLQTWRQGTFLLSLISFFSTNLRILPFLVSSSCPPCHSWTTPSVNLRIQVSSVSNLQETLRCPPSSQIQPDMDHPCPVLEKWTEATSSIWNSGYSMPVTLKNPPLLIANDIGTDFSLLYEEHAAVLERDGR